MSMINELCVIARQNLSSNTASRVIKTLRCQYYGVGSKTEEGIEECLRIYYEKHLKTESKSKSKGFSLFRNMYINNSTINVK